MLSREEYFARKRELDEKFPVAKRPHNQRAERRAHIFSRATCHQMDRGGGSGRVGTRGVVAGTQNLQPDAGSRLARAWN